MKTPRLFIPGFILLTALVLRLAGLDTKPVHFDEGVNGFFVDEITRNGFYHYDPTNFHGPLHFYLLFVAQTLFGRHAWALRLPTALISTACVGLVFLFRPQFGRRPCAIAAFAMAVSPAMVFYGRYAIHESTLLFFLLLTFLGMARLWGSGGFSGLKLVAGGLTGMILTKETYLIHTVCLALAFPALVVLNRLHSTSRLQPFFRADRWPRRDLIILAALSSATILFFYSGCLLDLSSIPGLWQAYTHWFTTGTGGATGHEKPWIYWLELLSRYEWPALAGLAATGLFLRPHNRLITRYLAIYGLGAATAYCLIAYKTPWCIIVLLWPFHFLFGLAVDRAFRLVDSWTTGIGSTLIAAHSLTVCSLLNFHEPTNEKEPYVYVQTLPEINRLLIPLRQLTSKSPTFYHLIGYIIGPEHHPLQWLLGDFTRVSMLAVTAIPDDLTNADFLLVDSTISGRIEAKLSGPYFREPLTLRGDSADSSILYLRSAVFAPCFPARTPEFSGPTLQEDSTPTPPAEPTPETAPTGL